MNPTLSKVLNRRRCIRRWPLHSTGCLQKCSQHDARSRNIVERPKWPMIILQTPKGWTGPKTVDGLPVEGSFRSHQVPISKLLERPDHLQLLEHWMRS